jgi:hypothetical protein
MANYMTIDRLYNNYEFKVLRRVLMRKFPWIKSVYVNEDELEKYEVIFLYFEIDPEEVAEAYGFELVDYIRKRWERPEEYETPFLSLLSSDFPLEEYNSRVADEIKKVIKEVHDSPALPEELKIPRDSGVYIGGYVFNKGKRYY